MVDQSNSKNNIWKPMSKDDKARLKVRSKVRRERGSKSRGQ